MKEYMIKKISGYENYMADTEGNVFRVKKDGLKILKPIIPFYFHKLVIHSQKLLQIKKK